MSVLSSRHRHRQPRLLRLAFAISAAVRLCVLLLAASAAGREPNSAAAHVETAGTTQHYVHDEATCLACVAQHLPTVAPRALALSDETLERAAAAPVGAAETAFADRRSPEVPRAPPAPR